MHKCIVAAYGAFLLRGGEQSLHVTPMPWSSVWGEKGGAEQFSSHLCTSDDADPRGQAV